MQIEVTAKELDFITTSLSKTIRKNQENIDLYERYIYADPISLELVKQEQEEMERLYRKLSVERYFIGDNRINGILDELKKHSSR